MKINLQLKQILFYCDLPEIFLSTDNVGTTHICLLVLKKETQTKFISTPISKSKLFSFLNGTSDLRDLFEKPEFPMWFTFDQLDEVIVATEWPKSSLPPEFLPERGFTYKKALDDEELIFNEVAEKENTVIHLAISDSENNSSANVSDIGDILKTYQSIVEYIYKKAVTLKKIKDKKSFLSRNNFELRAFESSAGSFNLHLYSSSDKNHFGETKIEWGLVKFDEIAKDFDKEDDFLLSLRSIKGHTIKSLKTLTKILIDRNLSLKHKWLSPSLDKVHYTFINKSKAEKIYNTLIQAEDLTEETVVFQGYLVQVDTTRGSWRILNNEDKAYYKGSSPPEDNLLKGTIMKTVEYKLTCKEILETTKVSENEKVSYLLTKIQSIK
jgi:hypothetical protein